MNKNSNLNSAAISGHLLARPQQPTDTAPQGLHLLEASAGRGGVLCVPARYHAEQPLPLAVVLHGAGGGAQRGIASLQRLATISNVILVVPESRGRTWDVIRGGFGPDVAFIDQALTHTFARYAVDPSRIAVSGFSDGASYALSLGLANGDLFTHIAAFSPGFVANVRVQGRPRIFITHGTHDGVLPIDRCSRRIVPQLQGAGYDVQYREFIGPHIVSPRMVFAALRWFRR